MSAVRDRHRPPVPLVPQVRLVSGLVRLSQGASMNMLSRSLVGGIGALLTMGWAASPALAMHFDLVPLALAKSCGQSCPKVITAEGEIDGDAASQFVRFLASHIHDRTLR